MQLLIEKAYVKKAQTKIRKHLPTCNVIENQIQTNQCRHKRFQVNLLLTNIALKKKFQVFSKLFYQLVHPFAPIACTRTAPKNF